MRLSLATALVAALAAATASGVAASDAAAEVGGVLDPFPSLRSVGDTHYTTVNGWASELEGGSDAAVAVKEAINEKNRALTTAIRTAKAPAAEATYEAFHDLARKQFEQYNESQAECKPGKKVGDALPLSFAFQGSGNLLIYYQGVVQGFYDAGVLTPEIAATAHFGGLSGGGLTSILTGLGFTGYEQLALSAKFLEAIHKCTSDCYLWDLTTPIIKEAILAKGIDDAAARLNGRLTLWTCQVDVLSNTNNGSVALGTSKWDSLDDLLLNQRGSGSLPCFSIGEPYTTFRGAGHIDGAYCADYAQLCPKTASKCLKISTTFVGPNLAGTPFPSWPECANASPPNLFPNPSKPYLTPKDKSLWKDRKDTCDGGIARAANVPFVEQGLTAKPDVFPFFYAPIDTAAFPDACAWLGKARDVGENDVVPIFETGRSAAIGWARANGYCA